MQIETIINYCKKYIDENYNLFITEYYNKLIEEDRLKLKKLITDNIELITINDLLIDYTPKELTERELLDFIKNTPSLKYIQLPILKYLLNSSDSEILLEVTNLVVDIYLQGDFNNIISGKRKLTPSKNNISILYQILTNPSFEINKEIHEELVEYLNKLELKLNRSEKGTHFQHQLNTLLKELGTAKKLSLLPDFYNRLDKTLVTEIPRTKNYYLQYKEIIKNINITNITKDTYFYLLSYIPSKLFKEVFEEKFATLNISKEDLINFIKQQEKEAKSLPLDLIYSFQAIYYLKNNCEKEIQKLKHKIRTSYKIYQKEHFYYTTEDFIDYYNKTENKDLNNLTLSSNKEPLTKEILISVLLDVPYILLNDLKDTEMVKNSWISSLNISENIVNQEEKNRKKRIYDLYNSKIEELKNRNDVTKEYFILNNIKIEDKKGFEELIAWYIENKKSYFNKSFNNKDNKFKLRNKELVLKDFLAELEKNSYANRYNIKNKYLKLISAYNLESTLESTDYDIALKNYEQEFLEKNCLNIFRYLLINKTENLYQTYQKSEFNTIDIKILFTKLKEKYPNFVKEIISLENKYFQDEKLFKDSPLAENSPYKIERSENIVKSYLNYNNISLKEFLKAEEITELIFYSALGIIKKENKELYDAYLQKKDYKRYNILLLSIKEVIKKIESCNCTYLDYRLIFKKLKLSDFYLLALNNNLITPSNEDIIKNFINKHQNVTRLNEKQLLSEKTIILIDGKEIEIKTEEKIEIINLLKALNLPKEKALYNYLLKMKLSNQENYKKLVKKQ